MTEKEESLAGKAPGPESPVEAVSGLSVRRPHLHSMDLQVQPCHKCRSCDCYLVTTTELRLNSGFSVFLFQFDFPIYASVACVSQTPSDKLTALFSSKICQECMSPAQS